MLKKIDLKDLKENVFTRIGDQWMLITAGQGEDCNTMTASWGGLGVIWGQPAATVYIRPQRYTKEFVDREEYFTLSFMPEQYKPQLGICGSKSGRDINKVKECGFAVKTGEGNAPYFAEADLVLVCRKRYAQAMDGGAMPADVVDHYYPGKDYHTMYIGQVVEAYVEG